MIAHFEDLWDQCEKFHKENSAEDDSAEEILNQLILKLTLLKTVESNSNLLKQEQEMAKSRLIGEILLSITNLSYKYNVNVFTALKTALTQNNIDYYDSKYSIRND